MPIPKYFEMQRPTLEALSDGQVKHIKDINAYVRRYFSLTDEDLEERLPSGRQSVFSNRTGWARTYLKKAGLISSPKRSHFRITETGKVAIEEAPHVIDNDYLNRFQSFKVFVEPKEELTESEFKEEPTILEAQSQVTKKVIEDEEETPDDRFESAFARIRESLESDLIDEVMKLTPRAFEQFALDLLGQIGYGAFENAGQVTNYVADDGIDGVIKEDKLGFSLIYVQAKQWQPDKVVSNSDIRNFVGALAGKSGKGLFITTAKFSKNAEVYARNQHIVLIDGQEMARLMIEHNFGASVKKTFEIKTIDTDIFTEYEQVESEDAAD